MVKNSRPACPDKSNAVYLYITILHCKGERGFHISGTAADECELFERIRGGDEQAFTLVYERYHGMLYSLALRMIKQTGAAEDAVQYVFVRLWELRGGLSVTVSLRNYLYTMTKTTS